MTTTDGITPTAFHEAEGLEEWRVVSDGATVFFHTSSLAESARLVQGLAGIEGIEDHPPALDVRRDGVTVRVITAADDWFGPTQSDLVMARRITALGDELGLRADPSAVQSLLVVPGAPKDVDIFPFWRAVLGYDPRPDSPEEDIVDPHDRGPALWFEEMNEPRPGGGGAIHLAVWVPPDQAEARVQAALAAGGRMVRDRSPSWWTLADPAGNEADVATVLGRD